ncbi:ABC transporter permease (plasmid) [Deinococcus psychrotolerans]|uniref:ABC transporter permease n=1 Tax=Deinococcus psychrotolerans TaxID=2489213 RepID=A0A3G8YJ11_9DEIO|nr:ABC transporter permease [Deinococcus psychrotolerans]AZI44953.1 ABC transporter permease [Deinococcus psychrotolerans]
MLTYLLRRLLLIPLIVLAISLVTFILVHLVPGDPASLYFGGQAVSEEALQNVRRQWGLDLPLPVQYLYYLGGVVRGNLGVATHTGQSVLSDIAARLPATVELTLIGMLLAVLIGIPLAVVAATRRNGWIDHTVRTLSLITLGVPTFWAGIVIIYLFNFVWRLLPPAVGRLPIDATPPTDITGLYLLDSLLTGNFSTFAATAFQLVAPALTVALGVIAVIIRMLRSSMVEQINQDYVRTARAKGLTSRQVMFKHALRNAIIPTITVVGIQLGYLLSGNALVETVFSWPGIGLYFIDSIQSLDYAAVLGVSMIAALIFALVNLGVDLLYAAIDPRIQYG